MKDMIGKTFGRLTVIRQSSKKDSSRSYYWRAKCKCGKIITINGRSLRSGDTKSCGCLKLDKLQLLVGYKNPNWKGGRHKTGAGYIEVRDTNHPNANKQGYVMEHIYNMSKKLKRPVKEGEIIHHIDFRKDNNKLSNLFLGSRQKHKIAEVSLYQLVATLLQKNIIGFRNGKYYMTEAI